MEAQSAMHFFQELDRKTLFFQFDPPGAYVKSKERNGNKEW